jgi:hypothetical protein
VTSTEGCVAATVTHNPYSSIANARVVGGGDGPIIIGGSATGMLIWDGTSAVGTTQTLPGNTFDVRVGWRASDTSRVFTSNGTSSTGTFDGSMGTVSTLHLGSNAGTASFLYGTVRNVRIGPLRDGCRR